MPTRSALRTEILRLLNDTNQTRFANAQLNTWLDMANSDAITRLGPFKVTQQTGTTATSEPNYQLATNTIHLKELFLQNVNNLETRLEILSQDELVSRYGIQWREFNASNPQVAYVVDYNVFGLHPKPNSDNSGKTWRAFYYSVPSAFASDTDSPIFLNALHDCLTWYCVSRGQYQLGNYDVSSDAFKRYETMIQRFQLTASTFSEDMRHWRWG